MIRRFSFLFFLCVASAAAVGQSKPSTQSTQPAQDPLVPAIKVDRDGNPNKQFLAKHEQFLKRAKEGKIDLLFLGDSITNNWSKAPEVWKEHYAGKYDVANFGIGGDRTQHVLWRITNGELEGIKPKVTVLMIGTNNIRSDPPEKIAAAVEKIVQTLRDKTGTKVLLLGIFPRGETQAAPERVKQQQVNDVIGKLDDGKNVRYLELWNEFLEPDMSISKEVMNDYLHPTTRGYEIWAKGMDKLLTEMMQQ